MIELDVQRVNLFAVWWVEGIISDSENDTEQ
jgi:hypothetical protein